MANETILVVDASGIIREQLSHTLRYHGYKVLTADNGGMGLTMAMTHSEIDLFIVDINMPNMNGLDFVREVTGKLDTPPPIVMITTEGSEEVISEAMSRGANGYLKKPFTPEKIQEVLGPLLG